MKVSKKSKFTLLLTEPCLRSNVWALPDGSTQLTLVGSTKIYNKITTPSGVISQTSLTVLPKFLQRG